MDYEKKYKEALERARDVYTYYCDDREELRKIESIFPELKESEDEKIIHWIRKELESKYVVDNIVNNEMADKALVWLEKQGEQKCTAEEVLIKAGLKPYKDGDQWCILLGDNIQEGICGFGDTIDDALYAFLNDLIKSQKEQKPAWSEEDEKILKDIITDVKIEGNNNDMQANSYKKINWLKSLKDRVQPKQEWSEEDEEKINSICNIIADKRNIQKQGYKSYYNGLISWLKSLRPQKQWKPTEDNIDQAISILEKAAKDIKIPEKYKTSDWLCEKEDDLIENLHRQLRDNILRAKEEAKNKI